MGKTYVDLQHDLQIMRTQLRAQLAELDSSVRQEPVGYSTHMADVGSEVFEQARDVSFKRSLERTLEDVEHALAKFEDGTYGICEMCGSIIDLPRLEVMPAARLCMTCQAKSEARR